MMCLDLSLREEEVPHCHMQAMLLCLRAMPLWGEERRGVAIGERRLWGGGVEEEGIGEEWDR